MDHMDLENWGDRGDVHWLLSSEPPNPRSFAPVVLGGVGPNRRIEGLWSLALGPSNPS